MTQDEEKRRTEFWAKIAGICFGLWAVAVPIAAMMIMSAVQKAIDAQESSRKEWQEYRLVMEKRITLIEANMSAMLSHLVQVDTDTREHSSRLNKLENNGKH